MDTTRREAVQVGGMTFDVVFGGPDGAPDDGATPVLLLHGFPQSASCWGTVSARLHAAGLRTIAPDQRGYSPGARPSAVEDYETPHLVGDVIGLLDALGLERVHLVGHDWGAAVAWHVAIRHPDRLATLTAVSVPHPAAFGRALREDADQQERSTYIQLFRQPGKAEELLLEDGARRLRAMYGDAVPAGQIEEHVRLLSEPGALTAALNWYRAMTAHRTSDVAGDDAVRVPTTYVWSTDDMALGRTGAEECGRHVTGPYRFAVLEGVTHWVPEQAPEELAELIVERAAG
ncbi:MAG: alpha/beta fold hydrolase [Streptosporangiales bacterium]|nr:alpha/beta fold hydrolase [Streptosporangiales bacterium]